MAVRDKQKLITVIASKVLSTGAEPDKSFAWFINKHTQLNFNHHYDIIDRIFRLLNGDLIAHQEKRTLGLTCDAYFGGSCNFIFEFDEFQHFSSKRLLTLNAYPESLKLYFDKTQWKHYCEINNAKADKYRYNKTTSDFNFPGGRTAQRAYLDCFRDLLPTLHGLRPTLRISEYEVADIQSNNKDSCKKLEKIIKSKLRY